MEKYIKKYFWTINLVAIAACSYYAAQTTNTFAGAWLSGDQTQATSVVQDSGKTETKEKSESTAAGYNPFTHEKMIPPEPIEDLNLNAGNTPPPESTDDPSVFTEDTSCPETKLPGKLVGTMVSSNPLASFAMIEDGDKKVKMFEIGDSIKDGALVVQVIRHRVFVKNNGKIECFFHGDKPKEKAKKAKAAPEEGDDIRKVSETEYIISKSFMANAMSNLNALATQARIVPSFKNGVGNGFRIYSIKPGSFYQKVGIKNGDIIQRVNEMDMDSPEKALTIYTKLKTENSLTLDLLRRGSKVSIDFTVQ